MGDEFQFLAEQLSDLRARDRLRRLIPYAAEGMTLVDPAGRKLTNFGSNDYLGFAAERTTESDVTNGAGASALVCGWSEEHERLREMLASYEGTESAVIFPSGFAACSGTVATLAAEGDLLLSDALNHASLIDGCRLSRAHRIIYPHRELDFVEDTLREQRSRYKHAWIVTDGVFSMDGHVAPLREFADVAERYDAHLIVDEAHATGVLGDTGSGVCEATGVKEQIPIRIGTLSKAVGAQGGFVVAPRIVCDYLINRCRTLIYSTALSPAAVAAAQSGIRRIQDEPQRRDRLRRNCYLLRHSLGRRASDAVEALVPIVTVPLWEDAAAVEASRSLAELGFFVPAIRPPTVPDGTARLRISLSSAHEEATVRELAVSLQRLV